MDGSLVAPLELEETSNSWPMPKAIRFIEFRKLEKFVLLF